jgi:hypothetical protein
VESVRHERGGAAGGGAAQIGNLVCAASARGRPGPRKAAALTLRSAAGLGWKAPAAALLVLLAAPAATAQFHVYIGQITSRSAVLAWGSTLGTDTIGKGSAPAGKAEVAVDGRPVVVDAGRNWVEVPLSPDSMHRYRVALDGRLIAEGEFRTYPDNADRLCFLVIGDYGVGGTGQAALARAMAQRVRDQEAGCPIRFVLTTGDNIYGSRSFLPPTRR